MSFIAALPKGIDLPAGLLAATFVVPAQTGCNLNCPFCVVRARQEAVSDARLSPTDYVRFLDALAGSFDVGLVSLQGYEPLLPESWAYSSAILEAGNALGASTAVVTNGTHLAECARDLLRLNVTGVTVSLDSATPDLHDLSRRTPGAFAMTLAGLKAACASRLRDRLIVTSILQPHKSRYLAGMPELLEELGIEQWVVTPLYKVRGSDFGGFADKHERIVEELRNLDSLAREHGVKLLVDDEFHELLTSAGRKVVNLSELRLRRLKRLDQAVRLSPDGTLSVGRGILRRVGSSTPTWRPGGESAEAFVFRVLGGDSENGRDALPSVRQAAQA
jgi:MoaA/NifB/PqqE/SkfB family radical SAM enzyme